MSFAKPASWFRTVRPMCDGRSFASSPFRRLASRGPPFRGFPFWWAMQLAISLARCLTLHDSAPRHGEGSQYEFGRPHDTLSCLFYTALWLGQCKSIVTQIQQLEDIDNGLLQNIADQLYHVLASGTHVLGVACGSTGGFAHSCSPPSREDLNEGQVENAHLAPLQSRWRRDALQPPEIQQVRRDGTRVHIPNGGLRCVTWNTRVLVGSPFSPQSSRERKHNYFIRLTQNNDIVCLQEIHVKDDFFQAIQILAPRFRLYGMFLPNNVNSGGSAKCIHKDLLPDDARVTHVVTCQGRDHIVSIRSGGRNLVVVNVHFEPDLTSLAE